MKVIKVRNAEVFDCVGVNQSRKKLVLRIGQSKYGGTNPLGFSFMPQDYRRFDAAPPLLRMDIEKFTKAIDALDKERAAIDAKIRVYSTQRRVLVEKLPQIDVESLPALKLLTRDESSKLWYNEAAIPGSKYNTPLFNATQLVEVPSETSDQSQA